MPATLFCALALISAFPAPSEAPVHPLRMNSLGMFLGGDFMSQDSNPSTQDVTKIEAKPDETVKIVEKKEGSGLKVQPFDMIEVEYVGKLLDGKVFDKTEGGRTFSFQIGVGQVIAGWEIGMMGIAEKGERTLTIPSKLAYGEQGAGDDIPPNATLVFDVKVVRIAPRVKVEILKEGTGDPIQVGDTLEVRYRGTLKDGKEFDQNMDGSRPALRFPFGGRVIPGFTQGLAGMKVGEKRKFVIPAELGYGKREIPPQDEGDIKKGSIIPANSDLTFEVELVGRTTKNSKPGEF